MPENKNFYGLNKNKLWKGRKKIGDVYINMQEDSLVFLGNQNKWHFYFCLNIINELFSLYFNAVNSCGSDGLES